MKQKILIFMLILLCSTTVVLAQKDKVVKESAEKVNVNNISLAKYPETMWKLLVDKKYDEYAAMLSDNFEDTTSDISMSKSEHLAEVRRWNLQSAEVSDVKVKMINKDAAVIKFRYTATATLSDGTARVIKKHKMWILAGSPNNREWTVIVALACNSGEK